MEVIGLDDPQNYVCKLSTNIIQESQTDVCAIKIVSLASILEQAVHDIADTSSILVKKRSQ